jgi:membrane protease YdiL (CAAX protease family)
MDKPTDAERVLMSDLVVVKRAGVNWKHAGLFLVLTFGLTWLLDLVLWLTVGYGQNPATGVLLQLQMLLPAFCAIALGMFVFEDSPLHQVRTNKERPRWFFYYFLVYTVIYVAVGAAMAISTNPTTLTIASGVAQGLTVLGLVILIILRVASGREAFARAGLAGGKFVHWPLFAIGFVLFYGLQTALNYVFHLGELVDIGQLMAQLPPAQVGSMTPTTFLLITGIQAVLASPFIALLLGFGEEYGWRGYLQSELIRLGKVKGIALLGVIWGLWHAPVIVMGHNYPEYPVAGIFLMTGYTVGLAFVLGYAVLKSGSVLLAAFLHALNNQVFSFLSMMVYKPTDSVFSFGAGVYGIAVLAVIVLLILLDPLWRER